MLRAATVIISTLLIGAPSATSAGPPQQFDLICDGTSKVQSGPVTPETRHYRFDLAANRWCRDACQSAQDIQSVSVDLITLKDAGGPGQPEWTTHRISRQTGDYEDSIDDRSIGFWSTAKGACKPAPFSGLPTPKF